MKYLCGQWNTLALLGNIPFGKIGGIDGIWSQDYAAQKVLARSLPTSTIVLRRTV